MAKIYSALSSSPVLGSYLSDQCDDYSLIRPDPSELFEDLLTGWGSTIWGDIQKMDSGNDLPISGTPDYISFKSEIRNSDCMWSGQSQTELSTSASSTGSDLARAVPLAAVTATPTTQLPAPTVVVANNNKSRIQIINQKPQQQQQQQQQQYVEIKTEIKEEPSDDYETELQQHSIPNVRTTVTPPQLSQIQIKSTSMASSSSIQSMQHIPPGTSLLRKSNNPTQQQQQMQLQQRKLQKHQQLQHKLSTLHLSNNNKSTSQQNVNSNSVVAAFDKMTYELPDTPPSLDDEATDFKQTNIDLRACMMGSNNISLNAGIIDNISKELQDTSKDKIHTRLTSDHPDIHEVLDVIMRDENNKGLHHPKSPSLVTTSMLINSATSDCESDEDEESTANSGYGSASSLLDGELSYGCTSPVSSQASSQASMSHHHAAQAHCHSDHSYTRCKEGIDDLSNSAYTPSDSDEEIDVVSVSDKKLPTNPSDRDRRAIEHKVGYRFSTARIVKNPNGIRTIPPRRRGSYTLPYTPASSSPVKSVSTSRYPSPSTTPYQHSSNTSTTCTNKYIQQQINILPNGDSQVITTNGMIDKSRKRLTMNGGGGGGGGVTISADFSCDFDYTLPPSKKHRGKKSTGSSSASSKHSSSGSITPTNGSATAIRRHFSLDETADTIEKRNLHNDMERQRRIGLKNLFEELKKQIPSIKDKERAPKVNILREAAKLCEALTRENQQLCDTKEVLREQMRKRQEHLARLRSLMRD
ncbi:myc protein isoform X2 [Eurosta solidaginis]